MRYSTRSTPPAPSRCSWGGRRPAEFFKGDRAPRFWVLAGSPLAPGRPESLRVRYHGDFLTREGDWVYLDPEAVWYPRPDGENRARFDLTFHVPDAYELASVGERVSGETRGGVVTSRWRMATPTRFASFNVGVF